MKTDLRYQNGFLYEHHGAWYVRTLVPIGIWNCEEEKAEHLIA